MNKKARNVLIITALLFFPLWFTIHDSRLAEVGWSSSLNDFLLALFVPLIAALAYELLAARITKRSNRKILAATITLLVALLWYELAANGLHESTSLLFG